MAMNPLPPQAYTKDTLLKAYSWLQNQNDSIKSLAITPDILVSLFVKAKMNGEASLERPSIQNFKAELKNLAGMMGEFDSISKKPLPSTHFVDNSVEKTQEIPQANSRALNAGPDLNGDKLLDDRSQMMIREVKNEFNLSSDQEALRLLISIGFKRMKNLE